MKYPMLGGLAFIFCASLANGQPLYDANQCFNQMNPNTSPSPDIRQKVALTNTKAYLTGLGYQDLILAVLAHRKSQCELKKQGKPFETECPVGSTIIADDLVQLQLDQHAHKSETALSGLLEKKKSELRAAAASMKAACE